MLRLLFLICVKLTGYRMLLKEILTKEKSEIVSAWFDHLVDTYPSDSENFLRNQLNEFSNPIGHTLRNETETLFQLLLDDLNPDETKTSLDRIIRIRAVQDFKPSQALEFFLALKKIIRNRLMEIIAENQMLDQLYSLESDIDRMSLMAFDVYTECREDLLTVRWGELKRRYAKLLEHTGIFIDDSAQEINNKK